MFRCLSIFLLSGTAALAQSLLLPWSGHGHDPQHSGISQVSAQPLQQIRWQTPIDLNRQYSGQYLLIHYASPLVTRQNTVVVPVKTGATDGFRVEARQGSNGTLKWMLNTDYSLPSHNWTPMYSLALTPKNRLCYAGVGGTVYYVNNPDTGTQPAAHDGRLVFYGLANYQASPATFDAAVKINTSMTSDRYGNLFFGYVVTGTVMLSGNVQLKSGIARIAEDGTGSWVAASAAASDGTIEALAHNQAPALSNDHKTLYIGV
ncbi:MAG: hypothetical protein JWO08_3847, partial [Verrucomicrobiaceae bacterium]|nr:hypothetical protein [Verrucomicrobiaceae bacterium]